METIKRIRSVFFNVPENNIHNTHNAQNTHNTQNAQNTVFNDQKRFDCFIEKIKYFEVLKKQDIEKIFGNQIKCVDFIIVYNANFFIPIRNKSSESFVSIDDAKRFIEEVIFISNFLQQKCVAFYLSRLKPVDIIQSYFNDANVNRQQSNFFISLHNPSFKKLIAEFMNILYENGIFLYEEDGSIIMQNNDLNF